VDCYRSSETSKYVTYFVDIFRSKFVCSPKNRKEILRLLTPFFPGKTRKAANWHSGRTKIKMSGNGSSLYENFVLAAGMGNVTTVLEMLTEGSVHVDGHHLSALYTACMGGCLSIVQALIQAGADMNLLSWPDEETALHAACSSGKSIRVVKVLLDAGANVNARSKSGETALLLLIKSKDICFEKKLEIAQLGSKHVCCKCSWRSSCN